MPAAPRVLLIEDNADCRESLRLLLEVEQYQVREAADGLEGVRQLLAWRPDVAIIDIGLPLLDGYRVARQARAALGLRPFLVALTAYGDPDDVARAIDAGFDVHLTKPTQPDRLCGLLAAVVGPRAAHA